MFGIFHVKITPRKRGMISLFKIFAEEISRWIHAVRRLMRAFLASGVLNVSMALKTPSSKMESGLLRRLLFPSACQGSPDKPEMLERFRILLIWHQQTRRIDFSKKNQIFRLKKVFLFITVFFPVFAGRHIEFSPEFFNKA